MLAEAPSAGATLGAELFSATTPEDPAAESYQPAPGVAGSAGEGAALMAKGNDMLATIQQTVADRLRSTREAVSNAFDRSDHPVEPAEEAQDAQASSSFGRRVGTSALALLAAGGAVLGFAPAAGVAGTAPCKPAKSSEKLRFTTFIDKSGIVPAFEGTQAVSHRITVSRANRSATLVGTQRYVGISPAPAPEQIRIKVKACSDRPTGFIFDRDFLPLATHDGAQEIVRIVELRNGQKIKVTDRRQRPQRDLLQADPNQPVVNTSGSSEG